MLEDYDAASSELLRALRGRRSQRGFSKVCGFGSNVAYRWEAGLRFPRVVDLFSALDRIGRPVQPALERFDSRCAALRGRELDHGYVRDLLKLFVAGRSRAEIARQAGLARLQVSRLLSGTTRIRLPVCLRLMDALTDRLVDFVGAFVDPAGLPSLRPQWELQTAWRRAAYEVPFTEAVVAHLETVAYAALPRHLPGWLAGRIGISLDEEEAAVEALAGATLIRRIGGRWVPRPERDIDTRGDPEAFERLKRFWSSEVARRLDRAPHGLCSYVVFCNSEAAIEDVLRVYARAYEDVRAILHASSGNDRVAAITMNCVPLDGIPIETGVTPR